MFALTADMSLCVCIWASSAQGRIQVTLEARDESGRRGVRRCEHLNRDFHHLVEALVRNFKRCRFLKCGGGDDSLEYFTALERPLVAHILRSASVRRIVHFRLNQ